MLMLGVADRSWCVRKITRALQNGDEVGSVTVRFDRANPNSVRPDPLEIECQINGNIQVRQFENMVGADQ